VTVVARAHRGVLSNQASTVSDADQVGGHVDWAPFGGRIDGVVLGVHPPVTGRPGELLTSHAIRIDHARRDPL
jgi:hypothetical protein